MLPTKAEKKDTQYSTN